MDVSDLYDLFIDNILYAVGTFVIIGASLALARTRMKKFSNTWDEYAAAHSLARLEEPITYNYGGMVGEREFRFPGLGGRIGGRKVAVLAVGITQPRGRERYGYVFHGTVSLTRSHAHHVLLHRRKLSRPAMHNLPPKQKTDDRAFDKFFTVYSDIPPDPATLTEAASECLAYLKARFTTVSFEVKQNTLTFTGRPRKQRIQPEHAHELMTHLAGFAAWVDSAWAR